VSPANFEENSEMTKGTGAVRLSIRRLGKGGESQNTNWQLPTQIECKEENLKANRRGVRGIQLFIFDLCQRLPMCPL